MIGRIELAAQSAQNVGQTTELVPYGHTGLVFKEGNENTDEQERYYAYINHYIKKNNIPGVYYDHDEDILALQDKIADMITNMIEEEVYIEAGTPVLGEIAESETLHIEMDEPPVKPKKKK